VNISSSCVYGNNEVMTETDIDFDPDTPYAITKLLGERYCQFWANQFNLDVVSLRFFNSYGPHEYPGQYRNVIPNFFKRAMAGQPLTITGTGQETRDFTFVEDTVQGILGALFGRTKPGDVFNIASGRETSILELAEKINRITGNRAEIQFVPRRSWDRVSRRKGIIEKAQSTFDYRPLTDLDEGLEKTYNWLKSVDE
jgi:nucleoside-diphosphate-sugar epimerase